MMSNEFSSKSDKLIMFGDGQDSVIYVGALDPVTGKRWQSGSGLDNEMPSGGGGSDYGATITPLSINFAKIN